MYTELEFWRSGVHNFLIYLSLKTRIKKLDFNIHTSMNWGPSIYDMHTGL